MATRRCRNRSIDLIHGGRLSLLLLFVVLTDVVVVVVVVVIVKVKFTLEQATKAQRRSRGSSSNLKSNYS